MTLIHASDIFAPDGRHDYDPEYLKPFFLEVEKHQNLMEGGYFTTLPLRKDSPTLVYDYLKNLGFSLIWKLKGPNGERGPTMVSVGRRLAMNHFTLSETLGDVSIGSCVSGEKAFQVLKDFAENPNVLSGAVDWVDIMTLQWPEP